MKNTGWYLQSALLAVFFVFSFPDLGPVFRALHGSRNQCVSRSTGRESHATVGVFALS